MTSFHASLAASEVLHESSNLVGAPKSSSEKLPGTTWPGVRVGLGSQLGGLKIP